MWVQFKKFVIDNALIQSNQTVLLAFSGGSDSVVLCHLLQRFGANVKLAHVNYGLRGKDSENDEHFVRSFAEKNGFELFVLNKKLSENDIKTSGGIESAARKIRYDWFEKLVKNDWIIATGHHADDHTETFILNLLKGRGIAGQTGIVVKRGKIVRPILFASKVQILSYCNKHSLSYCIDTSNLTNDYDRNFLRNNVIPLMKQLNPSLNEAIRKETEYRRLGAELIQREIKQLNQGVKNNSIPLPPFRKSVYGKLALFNLLESFHFDYSQCENILSQTKNGRVFISRKYKAVTNRDCLQVEPILKNTNEELIIQWPIELSKPFELKIIITKAAGLNSKDEIWLDAALLPSTLTIRRWQKGDFFYPSGMTGRKKLSDFFIDQKLSLLEKEKQWLLAFEKEIIWIIGKRVSRKYLANEKSKEIVHIKAAIREDSKH